jgi:hypothetical protein
MQPAEEQAAIWHSRNGVQAIPPARPSIRIKAPGQDKIHSFSKRTKLSQHHPLGIPMQIASKGHWENPPTYSSEYERVSKAFQRFRALLRELIPLPEEPFTDSQGLHTPRFRVKILGADELQ